MKKSQFILQLLQNYLGTASKTLKSGPSTVPSPLQAYKVSKIYFRKRPFFAGWVSCREEGVNGKVSRAFWWLLRSRWRGARGRRWWAGSGITLKVQHAAKLYFYHIMGMPSSLAQGRTRFLKIFLVVKNFHLFLLVVLPSRSLFSPPRLSWQIDYKFSSTHH